ncbi:MAG: 23S rRNA (guanosine(2251)-2'-O)-methyltransferase RlmB [Brevinemataceae bacterium]
MFIYGRNSIEEALTESLQLTEVWFDKDKCSKYPGLRKMIREKQIPMNFVSSKELDKISGTQKHQGVTAQIALPENIVTEDQSVDIDFSSVNKVLLLDGITDTGNLGAIIRSALLLGADLILLPKDNSARITPQTIRSSAGAIYKINLIYVDNLKTQILKMKELNFEILALTGESKDSIFQLEFSETLPIALVLGSEREGIRKGIKNLCTRKVFIPSTKKLDSFNVSVAAALAMQAIWGKDLAGR